MKVDLGVFTNNSSNTDINNTLTVTKPLLYFDNNNTYEPYTGLKPSPSSDYEQPINSIEGSLEFACSGRNLLSNKASSQTINDVIYTVKDDGSVIVNGTATARANLFLFANSENPIKLIPGNCCSFLRLLPPDFINDFLLLLVYHQAFSLSMTHSLRILPGCKLASSLIFLVGFPNTCLHCILN